MVRRTGKRGGDGWGVLWCVCGMGWFGCEGEGMADGLGDRFQGEGGNKFMWKWVMKMFFVGWWCW